MFNKKLITAVLVVCVLSVVCGCSATTEPVPTQAQIESLGIQANQGRQNKAYDQLQHWAEYGLPVAQRELALTLLEVRGDVAKARAWLEKAAAGGDGESAFRLGEAYHYARLGVDRNDAAAWKFYRLGADSGDDRSALMLARMAKYGEGTKKDLVESVQWLTFASEHGNAQAMFLLSNAYQSGEGVAPNEVLARAWLEKAAAGDYPVAIQALALAVEGGDLQIPKDATRAQHLFKEAAEERRDHWNN
ncbi:MAG TPA: tetratricopeptide repeat protein [Burkholderiaceae bacterium]|jgi:hypothetical protein